MRIDEENIYNNNFDSLLALGLMSGTSLDGVDVALLSTDGNKNIISRGYSNFNFPKRLKNKIEKFIINRNNPFFISRLITDFHICCIKDFINKNNIKIESIDLIGFHGHTVFHKPNEGWSWQIGDGQHMSNSLKIPVVSNFRYRDVCLGGEGAPLVPIWHLSLINSFKYKKFPCAFLNIGGIANISYLMNNEDIPTSFDIGPGNTLLDFIMKEYFNREFDKNGVEAEKGNICYDTIQNILSESWFNLEPPKSLDKNELNKSILGYTGHLSPNDKAATLAKLISSAAKKSISFLASPPRVWYICGGGRLNKSIIKGFHEEFGETVYLVDEIGWNGDSIEAEAFAYLAVRSMKGMACTWKNTTGVGYPTAGGLLSYPRGI